MSGSGREALPDDREWSEAHPNWMFGRPSLVFGRPSLISGKVWWPTRMSCSGLEALLDVREALPDIWEWSGGPPGCPGVVERPSLISVSGREALSDVRVCSVGPPGCP